MSSSIKAITVNSDLDWSLCLEESATVIGAVLEETNWTKIRIGVLWSIYSSSHANITSGPRLAIGLCNNMTSSIYGAETVENFLGVVCVPTSLTWNSTYNHYDLASTNGTLRKVSNSVETNASSVLNAWDIGATTEPPDPDDYRTGLFIDISKSGTSYTFKCFTKTSALATDISDNDFSDLMESPYQQCVKTGYSYYSERSTTFDESSYPLNSICISWNKPQTLAISRLAYSFLA